VLGLSHNERLTGMVNAIAEGDAGEGLRLITEATDSGEDIHQLNRQMIGYLRLLLHIRAGGRPPEADGTATDLANRFTLDHLTSLVRSFSEIDGASNKSSYPQLPLELAVVRAIVGEPVPANVVGSQQPAQAPPAPAPQPPPPTRSQSRQAASREVRESRSAPSAAREPAQPPSRQAPPASPASARPAPQNSAGNAMLEHLVANWSHIRRDIKAENSRIAALLSSADPASVTDDKIILAAPYEFHRNKLNEDSVRQVIERVLEQYTHQKLALLCMAPDDVPQARPANSTTPPAPQPETRNEVRQQPSREPAEPVEQETDEKTATAPAPTEHGDEDPVAATEPSDTVVESDEQADQEEQRVQAAKRIFEARETDS
jgi:DNA polymerase III subunit gamma/tau